MAGSLLDPKAQRFSTLWQDYWGSRWHRPVLWEPQRLACFIDAATGRNVTNPSTGEPLVTDFPTGRRPFLGALTLGRKTSPSPHSGVIEYNDDGHLLTIAPTRSGKGAAQIVPNLLAYAGSCLVLDIKGENFAITGKHRAALFEGAKVFRFAPFEQTTDRYNPLDFIRVDKGGLPNSYTFDDARLIAEMLIPAKAKEEFWDTEARNLLTTLLLYVGTRYAPPDPRRNMREVTRLLFRTPDPEKESAASGPLFDKTLTDISEEAALTGNIVLEALVTGFREHEPKVRSNVLSTCRSEMMIWLSERLQTATECSDFQFSELKASMCRPAADNPAPTTLYVIIPPEYLREYRTILRMMVGLAAVELTREGEWTGKQAEGWRTNPPCPVLFLLDEFPSLGYMTPIVNGLAYLAGYGVQIWTFAQSLGQLKGLYAENWDSFIANAGAACYFGVTDPDAAELISKQLGETDEYEHWYETNSESTAYSDSSTSSSASSYGRFGAGDTSSSSDSTTYGSTQTTGSQEHVRFKRETVARPSDIRALASDLQIIFLRSYSL